MNTAFTSPIRWPAAMAVLVAAAIPGLRPATAGEGLDLSRAVVLTPTTLAPRERKAVAVLVEDVARRSGIRWNVSTHRPEGGTPIIAVGPISAAPGFVPFAALPPGVPSHSMPPEGYRILTRNGERDVLVAGNDARGVLFGVGRLLRELRTVNDRVWLERPLDVTSSPAYTLRGHQLGYRPKTNSYDGWDLPRWDRYIRDLAIFGTNAVELIPPRSDDDSASPLFPRPPLEMMVGMSRLLDDYGLDVWIWYPALDRDYTDPATVTSALQEWDDVFRRLPRLDAIFVPGGDPGHTPPKVLFPFLARVAEVLHRSHPKAGLWVSPQGFNQEWLDEFLQIIQSRPLPWLSGVVHGPQVRISLANLRRAVPARYPIRSYPDITHSQQCQFPVPDWDVAFSLTEGREAINPRPTGEAAIFHYYQPGTIGFISYSEGCNDDVNKFVWSGLGWDPKADVAGLLRQYTRAFIDDAIAERFAEGLLALEKNWQGPLRTNDSVERTLSLFEELDRQASPGLRANWRFQQALYRACYDAHVCRRLIAESQAEAEAHRALAQASKKGSLAAMSEAEQILRGTLVQPDLQALSGRIRGLAEDLFVSIRMQLSEPLYDAIAVDRGANLDALEVPLTSRLWLRDQFAALRQVQNEGDRLRGLDAIVHRNDPGPGGFYDDLGNLENQPHLVREPDFAADPDFRHSALVGFGSRAGWPIAWCQNAQTLHDAPLRLRYDALDPKARYKVRIVYAGDSFRNKIRLDADDHPVHGWYTKLDPPAPVEFDVPPAAKADGKVTLTWRQEPGKGANGRGCQVAEVWMIKK